MNTSKNPILIFECANAHGGNFELLKLTVKEYSTIPYFRKHIKFQPFHADSIALPDYNWYSTYLELMFQKEQWTELLDAASTFFEGVWLDIFDTYGIEVLEDNADKVIGIKLQASVLENQEIISALSKLCMEGKYCMLNISGYELTDIERFIDRFSSINSSEIILQIGFQSYPTLLEDTGLQKIRILRSAFPTLKICLADHAPAEDDYATIIPLLGLAEGCGLIEKHICLDRASAKYDYYSALQPSELQLLANQMTTYPEIVGSHFISTSEREYLRKSIQYPIALKTLSKGSLVAPSDVFFRRTNQSGSAFHKISEMQHQRHILAESLDANTAINLKHFRLARIGVIVACRMKSSRLKNKAIVPIAGIASVERCLSNCLGISGVEEVILATSTLEEDRILENYTLDGKVKFWQGHPDDVIQRYLGACDAYDIDVVVRVTADCPVISSEIAEYLLDQHFASGADYTAATDFAVGTACEIYNTEALKRVIKYLGKADYSEYMTWYLRNNPHLFKLHIIDLPIKMVRNYRLTLDHPEDLEMFNRLYEHLDDNNITPNLQNVFEILDQHPELISLNSHLTLRYKSDEDLIEKLNRITKINCI